MSAASTVAGIVLAAGMSKRFGSNKLLAPWRGKALVRWPVEAALGSRLGRVVVVLGYGHEPVRAALADLLAGDRLEAVVNTAFRRGQSGSVIAGLDAVREDASAAMFLMGDQPLLNAELIDDLISAFTGRGKDICHPSCNGTRRTPAIFGRRFFPDILALTGDTGARAVIDANPDAAHAVEYTQEQAFLDVDRQEDLPHLEETRL